MSEKWSPGWLVEGHFISYEDPVDEVVRYAFIKKREFAHYEYTWPEAVEPGVLSGTETVTNLEVTVIRKQVWQIIFGFKEKGRYYVHLPVDVDRHGIAKRAKPTLAFPTVAHYEEWMSPWDNPDWITEHFLIRPITPTIAFSYHNMNPVAVTPRINFFINKCDLELLGYEKEGALYPAQDRYREILDKLYRRVVPHRPLSLMPVRAPAEAP